MIFSQGRRSRRRQVNWLKIGAIKEPQDSLATFRLVICNSGNSSICCWIFGCISQAVFCHPQGNTSLSSCRVQPKFLFLHLSKGKTIHGNALKILSPHFSCRKNAGAMHWKIVPSLFMPKIGCSNTLKIENLQNVQNAEGYPQKENRQRTVRSSACCSIYFRNRNRIVWSRFRLSYFVTVLIQVSARTLPSSAAMQIEIRLWTLVAHAGRNFCIRFF